MTQASCGRANQHKSTKWHMKKNVMKTERKKVHRAILFGQVVLAGFLGWLSCSTVLAQTAQPKESLAVDLGGGMSIEFVLIRPGSFMMGSMTGNIDEKPPHKVTLSKPFYLGKYEVTQEQWQAVMGRNPSQFKGPQNPVENVRREDCQVFIGRLNKKAGAAVFRLPTEAEWEYACRAGSTTDFSFGEAETTLGDYAWYIANSGIASTHPVGQKKPNAWGLYDMHGNVMEWCLDGYGDYTGAAVTDPVGTAPISYRIPRWVVRGGSWSDDAGDCRSARRNGREPGGWFFTLGFRLLRNVSP